jgi:hypothetical protein
MSGHSVREARGTPEEEARAIVERCTHVPVSMMGSTALHEGACAQCVAAALREREREVEEEREACAKVADFYRGDMADVSPTSPDKAVHIAAAIRARLTAERVRA